MFKKWFLSLVVFVVLSVWLCISAQASIIFSAEGTSGVGTIVKFKAELSISGDDLTVELTNESTEGAIAPDDLLSSFYFDIWDGSTRPTLTYVGATGDVWLADKDNPDTLQTTDADILADSAGDDTWQFRTMDETAAPLLGFGIGSVGNNNLAPNNFQGNIVDGMDYSIYAGELTTQNLDNKLFVKDTATFTFAGLTDFDEGDIASEFAFGLGTAPDSLIVPEPSIVLLLSIGIVGVVCLRRD